MEQIYYTQCPIGYGLGASNGFQVKRITPGYPVGSDFRHLGLRAFLAGHRTLAPPTLRYRRTNNDEIAWLTPRPLEYETERGQWGRPGGHFAHGLILNSAELAAIYDWPAVLFGLPFWRKSDPEPSRGRLPDPIQLSVDIFNKSLSHNTKDIILSEWEPDLIARILTAIAQIAREGRTLFLIDDAVRLGPIIAGLTFIFPPPLRSELTFSTYHDRPEELPGFRLHGTTPNARPNRTVLLTQGMIVDLKSKSIEPWIEPAPWSLFMTDWLMNGDDAKWIDFTDHLARSTSPDDPHRWDDSRFESLIGFGETLRQVTDQVHWPEIVRAMTWASHSNLTEQWIEAHQPEWWLQIDPKPMEGREALLTLASWRTAWTSANPGAWAQVVAQWFVDADVVDREAAVVAFIGGAPTDRERLAFVRALRRNLPPHQWPAIRRRLNSLFPVDSRMSGSLAVADGIASALQGDSALLRTLVPRFYRSTEASLWLLEIATEETENDPDKIGKLCDPLASLFDRPDVFRWAIRRADRAMSWLRPFLRRSLALPDSKEDWRNLIKDTPVDLLPNLAVVLIKVASQDGMLDEALLWAIDEVLLVIPEDTRPTDPGDGWASRYLERSRSDLDLIGRLYLRGSRVVSLRSWLDSAAERGELSPEHASRMRHIKTLARTLDARTLGSIGEVDLLKVPGSDRGPLLARWLDQGRPDPASILDQCGSSWSESFKPGSANLSDLAIAVANSPHLAPIRDDPATWFYRLAEIARRLTREVDFSHGFVSAVVAQTTRIETSVHVVWTLRSYLFNEEVGWKCLLEDLRLDLIDEEPSASPIIVERWDRALNSVYPDRFWEVVLNACDGRRLSEVVSLRAKDLQSLGRLRWWDHLLYPDASNDLRDAFARFIPLAPLNENSLADIQSWMRSKRGFDGNLQGDYPWLSDDGRKRWNCIERLTYDIFRKSLDDQARRFNVLDWCKHLPLSSLALDDRYRLVAWVLFKIEDESALDRNQVGKWLVKSDLTELDRVTGWAKELEGLVEIPCHLVKDRAGLAMRLRQEMRRVIDDMRESERAQFRMPPAID